MRQCKHGKESHRYCADCLVTQLEAENAQLRQQLEAWAARMKAVTGEDAPDTAGNVVISLKQQLAEALQKSDERHDALCAEKRSNDQLRQQLAYEEERNRNNIAGAGLECSELRQHLAEAQNQLNKTSGCPPYSEVVNEMMKLRHRCEQMKEALQKIAGADYRGNRSLESTMAHVTLAALDVETKTTPAKCPRCGALDAIMAHLVNWRADFFDNEWLADLCPILVKHGLMRYEPYEPEGKHGLIDCEADEGDMIYVWTEEALKATKG